MVRVLPPKYCSPCLLAPCVTHPRLLPRLVTAALGLAPMRLLHRNSAVDFTQYTDG